MIVRKAQPFDASFEVAIGVHVDAVFGPVITLRAGRAAGEHAGAHAVLLPPLNERLAGDLVRANRASGPCRMPATRPMRPRS